MVNAMKSILDGFFAKFVKRGEGGYGLLLQETGPNRDKVVTLARNYGGLEAAAAAGLVDRAPVMVLEDVDRAVAVGALRAFEMAGAQAALTRRKNQGRPEN